MINSLAGNKLLIFLPVSVFFLSGLIDTSLNYANLFLINEEDASEFTITLFFFAALAGTVAFGISGKKPDVKSLPWGIVLGLVNLFSVVFLLKTLTFFNNDGAFTFPVINIGIIVLATFASKIIFKDIWNRYQVLGIALGLVSLFLIAHQEIINFFS
jgi:drug/metabolite transporter (DMT)-like permease